MRQRLGHARRHREHRARIKVHGGDAIIRLHLGDDAPVRCVFEEVICYQRQARNCIKKLFEPTVLVNVLGMQVLGVHDT